MPRELTEKQRLFAEFYTGEAKFDATVAAEMAGYKGNFRTVASTASRLLRNDLVRDYLDKKSREAADRSTVITPERLIELLAGFAEDTELNTAHRLRAIENLCKVFGMNLHQIKVDANVKVEETRTEIRAYLNNPEVADTIKRLEGNILDSLDESDSNDIVLIENDA
jgi:phage terminase small subunit